MQQHYGELEWLTGPFVSSICNTSQVSSSGVRSSRSSSSAGTNPVIAHHPSAAVQTRDCLSEEEEEEKKMSLNAKIGVVFLEGELPPPLTSVVGLAAVLENPQSTDWQLHPTRPTTASADRGAADCRLQSSHAET